MRKTLKIETENGTVTVWEYVDKMGHAYSADGFQTVIKWRVNLETEGGEVDTVDIFNSTHHSYVQAFEFASNLADRVTDNNERG